MQIIGKLIQRNEPVTGTSQRGEWKKWRLSLRQLRHIPRRFV